MQVQAMDCKDITQVQCAASHIMALTSSGYVFTWGCNKQGNLGHGTSSSLRDYSVVCG